MGELTSRLPQTLLMIGLDDSAVGYADADHPRASLARAYGARVRSAIYRQHSPLVLVRSHDPSVVLLRRRGLCECFVWMHCCLLCVGGCESVGLSLFPPKSGGSLSCE